MAKFEITAPALGFNGDVAGVAFAGGRATVDTEREGDAAALGYFRRKGYTIVEAEETGPEAEASVETEPVTAQAEPDAEPGESDAEPDQELKPPAKSAPKAEWAEYARSLADDPDQVDAIDDMTKDQLIETYGQGEQA